MLRMPIDSGKELVIIEPGNIRRLKEGRPLLVELPNGSSIMIAFTPDLAAFVRELGVDPSVVDVVPGTQKEARGLKLTPGRVQDALDKIKSWPEVER